jgi:hypothetical protein
VFLVGRKCHGSDRKSLHTPTQAISPPECDGRRPPLQVARHRPGAGVAKATF